MAAAAGETPGAAQAIAALDADRLALAVPGAPGEAVARIAEHRSGRLVRHGRGRGRRGDIGLVDEPADAGIRPGQRLGGLAVFQQVDLLAAEALGQQQAQHVLADQRLHHLGRQFATAVHLGAVLVQQGLQGASPFRSACGDRRLNAAIHGVSSVSKSFGHTGPVATGVNPSGATLRKAPRRRAAGELPSAMMVGSIEPYRPAAPRRKRTMITKFDSSYVGTVDMENLGYTRHADQRPPLFERGAGRARCTRPWTTPRHGRARLRHLLDGRAPFPARGHGVHPEPADDGDAPVRRDQEPQDRLRLQRRADVASAAPGGRLCDGRHPDRRPGHLRRRRAAITRARSRASARR